MVRNGLIIGMIMIIVTMVIYFIDVGLFGNSKVGMGLFAVSVIVYLIYLTKSVREERSENGGMISFGEAFKASFITGAVAVVLSTVFTMLLFNVINPEAKEIVLESQIESATGMMEMFGADDDAIDLAISQMEDQNNFAPGKLAIGLLVNLAIGAIVCLIIAAIMKKVPLTGREEKAWDEED